MCVADARLHKTPAYLSISAARSSHFRHPGLTNGSVLRGRALIGHLSHRPCEARPLLARLRLRAAVLLRRQPLELTLELAPALEALQVERPVRERGTDRAAGLAPVRTVGEPALCSQRLDVLERRLETGLGIPQLQLAHSGRVEHETAFGKPNELPVRGRVPAAAVLADVARRE